MTMPKKDKKSEGLKRNLRIENLENRQLLSAMSVVDADTAAFAPALLDQPAVDFGDSVVAPEDVAAESVGDYAAANAIGKKITFATVGLTNADPSGYYTVKIVATKGDTVTTSVKTVASEGDFVLSLNGKEGAETVFTVYEGKYTFSKLNEALSAETPITSKAYAKVTVLATPKLKALKDVKGETPVTDNVTDTTFKFTSDALNGVVLTNLTIYGAFDNAAAATTYSVKADGTLTYDVSGTATDSDYEISGSGNTFTIDGLKGNSKQVIQISYKSVADSSGKPDAISATSSKLTVKTEKTQLDAPTNLAAAKTEFATASSITVTFDVGDNNTVVGQKYTAVCTYNNGKKDVNKTARGELKQATADVNLWWDGTNESSVVATGIANLNTVTGYTGYQLYTKSNEGGDLVQQTRAAVVWTNGTDEVAADAKELTGLSGDVYAKAATTGSIVFTGLKANTSFSKFTVQAVATKDFSASDKSEELEGPVVTDGTLLVPAFKKTGSSASSLTFQITNWVKVAGQLTDSSSRITITADTAGDANDKTYITKHFAEIPEVKDGDTVMTAYQAAGWYTFNGETRADLIIADSTGFATIDDLNASTEYAVQISTTKTVSDSTSTGTSRVLKATTEIKAWDAPTIGTFTTDTNTLTWTVAYADDANAPAKYLVTATPTTENVPTVAQEYEAVSGNNQSAVLLGLVANVEYEFKVCAVADANGSQSLNSETTTGTTNVADAATAPVVTVISSTGTGFTAKANIGTAYGTTWTFKVKLEGLGTYERSDISGYLQESFTCEAVAFKNDVCTDVVLTLQAQSGTTFEVMGSYSDDAWTFTMPAGMKAFSGTLSMQYVSGELGFGTGAVKFLAST